MKPAKSIAILTLVTLLISVFLPLSAFAASEVHVSLSGNQNISIKTNSTTGTNSVTIDRNDDNIISPLPKEETLRPTPKDDSTTQQSARLSITRTPTPTKNPTATPTPRVRRLRTPTPTKTLTPTPTTRPTNTPTPTNKPTATPTQKPTNTPTPSLGEATNEKQTYIMNAINAYRKSLGLSPVKTDPYTCNFAKIRAQEITAAFNHDGFRNRINNDTLPYPDYSQVTENLAMTSNYKNVVTMWINSPGHAENMRRDTPYVCVEASGNYYAYEGWRP